MSNNETVEIDVTVSSQRQVKQDGDGISISIKCEISNSGVVDGVPINHRAIKPKTEECNEEYQNEMIQYDDGYMDKDENISREVKQCHFYKRHGKCKYGENCYFSHNTDKANYAMAQCVGKQPCENNDPNALSINDSNFNEISQENGEGSLDILMKSFQKHPMVVETAEQHHMEYEIDDESGENSYLNINSYNAKPCRYFMAKMGCKLGDNCPFTHYRSVGDAGADVVNNTSLSLTDSINLTDKEYDLGEGFKIDNNQKPPQQEETKFLESQQKESQQTSEIALKENDHEKALKKRCKWFLKDGNCLKGDNCKFKHVMRGEGKVSIMHNGDNAIGDAEELPVTTLPEHIEYNAQIDNTTFEAKNDFMKNNGSDSSYMEDRKICHFFMRPSGCWRKDKCQFLHLKSENSRSNHQTYYSTDKQPDTLYSHSLEENYHNVNRTNQHDVETNYKKKGRCRFQTTSGGCNLGSKCTFIHDNPEEIKSDSNIDNELSRTQIEEYNNDTMNATAKTTINSDQICRFYLLPKGCFKGNKCSYLHTTENKENKTSIKKDYLSLQQNEYKQLETRFSADNKFVLIQSEPSTIYLITFEPSDPDWGIVVKEFCLQFEFPQDYPKTLFTVKLQDTETYPERFASFMNEGIQTWIDARKIERDEHDLAFRPFMKWFDRNAETLVLDAGKKVKSLRDAEECGITLIPHNEILQKDENDCLESEPSTLSDTEDYPMQLELSDNETKTVEVNAIMAVNENTAYNNQPKLSSKVKFGTEIKFSHLEVNENAASILLKNIFLIVQCLRCKGKTDFKLQSKKHASSTCRKCHVNQSAVFYPEIIHQHSHIVGYLHLEGCRAFDLVLLDSAVVINCLNCSKDNTKKGIAYGRKGDHWCEYCHTKIDINVQSVKFTQLQKNGDKAQQASKPVEKKPVKYPGIKLGESLPDEGTCKHYKKSYRWLRFPCCGKLYPCDVCHEESEENEHEMKFATRMVCGFCSKEQPYSKEKPCVNCKCDLTKSRSVHWEGGKGCRNKTKMARNDKQKTAGLGKTVSRKKANEH